MAKSTESWGDFENLLHIPKHVYRRMSGRETKILHVSADRHALPLRGRYLNLPDIIRRFHDILAEHSDAIRKSKEARVIDVAPGDSPNLERQRAATADLRELELAQRRGELVPRDEMHRRLMRMSSILREGGMRLRRDHGEAPYGVFKECLDVFTEEVERAAAERRGQLEFPDEELQPKEKPNVKAKAPPKSKRKAKSPP